MMYFWFVLMIMLSAFWLIWFLYHPLKNNTLNLQNSNIALGRHKQAELQRDLEQGLIAADAFEQAQEEIAQTLAAELTQTSSKTTNKQTPIWLSVLIVVVIAGMSLGVYQILSPNQPQQTTQLKQQTMPLSLQDSALQLQNYLLKNSNDANAWQALGLTYFKLNRLDESLSAYEKSYQLDRKNTKLLIEYASTIAIKNDNDFSGRSIELVKQALQLEPNAPDALYMAGLYAVSQQDFALAQLLWQKALTALKPGSADAAVLLGALNDVSHLMEIDGKQATHTIKVNVSFSQAILANRSKDDYVMIYAKAAKGRPMPISIVKTKLKDFTGQVILNDANSLIASNKLSQASTVVVVVRLSKTGAAFKQIGDIEVLSKVLNIADNPILDLQVK